MFTTVIFVKEKLEIIPKFKRGLVKYQGFHLMEYFAAIKK